MPFLAPIGAGIAAAAGAIGSVGTAVLSTVSAGLAAATSGIASAAAAIGGTIASGLSAAGSAISTVVGGVDSVISGAASIAEGTVGHVIAALGSAAGKAFEGVSSALESVGALLGSVGKSAQAVSTSGVVSAVSTIIDRVAGFFTTATVGLGEILKPITDTVDTVQTFVQKIQDTIVKPLVDPITQTVSAVETLTQEFHSDLKAGLQGIIKIPGQVADALTGVDASFHRSMQELGIANEAVAKEITAPAIANAARPGLDALGEKLTTHFSVGPGGEGFYSPDVLPFPKEAKQFEEGIHLLLDKLPDKTSLLGKVLRGALDVLQLPELILATIQPRLRAYEQMLNQDYPTTLLDPATLLEGWRRGVIRDTDLEESLTRQGYDPTRVDALKQLAHYLPGTSEALTWAFRGFLTDTEAAKILSDRGYDTRAAEAAIAAAQAPVNPRARVAAFLRAQAASGGFLQATLESDVPNDVQDAYRKAQFLPEQGKLDWLLHWRVPDSGWWVQAFFRGLRTRTEIEAAFRAENIPPEIWPDLVEVERTLIQLWMIPDMIAAGVFTVNDAVAYLRKMGLTAEDAQVIVRYGQIKGKSSKTTTAADLQKLSLGNAKAMYTDGIIDRPTYVEVLREHGYSADAAELTAELADQEHALAQRKQDATTLVDLVDLGQVTVDQAIAQLFAAGYTTAEVAKYEKSMHRAKGAKAKLPSKSELDALLKKAVIDAGVYVDTLQLIGYSAVWAQRFLELATGG